MFASRLPVVFREVCYIKFSTDNIRWQINRGTCVYTYRTVHRAPGWPASFVTRTMAEVPPPSCRFSQGAADAQLGARSSGRDGR